MFVHRIIYIIFIKKSKDFLTFFEKIDFIPEKTTLKTNLKRFFKLYCSFIGRVEKLR